MKKIILYTRSLGHHVYAVSARIFISVAILLALGTLTACDHSELWDDLPYQITKFINQYYPNSELQSVSHSGNRYHVRIDDGPGMTFDEDEQCPCRRCYFSTSCRRRCTIICRKPNSSTVSLASRATRANIL